MPRAKKETAEAMQEEVVETNSEEVTEETSEDALQEDVEANEEATVNEKEGYVDYILPFLPGTQQGDCQTVTVNGKNYQVQYGIPVKVPVGVKEILEDMVKASYLLKKKVDRLTEKEQCIAKLD